MTDFFKDQGILDGLSLSDISEVDPNELEEIKKSAAELDRKYLGTFESVEKSDPKKKDLKQKKLNKEGVTEDFGVSKESYVPNIDTRHEQNFSPDTETKPTYEKSKKLERHNKGSADWLGLKDSPSKKSHENVNPESLFGIEPLKQKERIPTASKRESVPSTPLSTETTGATMTPATRPKNKNKGILLNELFGDELKLPGDESSAKIEESPSITQVDGIRRSTPAGYTPSSATRRAEKRQDLPSTSSRLAGGLDGDLDWLKDTKPSPKRSQENYKPDFSDVNISASNTLQTAVPTSGSKKESRIPDWLEEIVRDTPQKEALAKDDPRKLPDWLGGEAAAVSISSQPLAQETQHSQHRSLPAPQGGEIPSQEGNIVSKLASVQLELAAALSKRSENIQAYMQELMSEAKRISTSVPSVVSSNNNAEEISEKVNASKNEPQVEENMPKKELMEELTHKEDIIHDLEMKVNRLELQVDHLEMKIQNMISTHEMEKESLMKSHGFEISAWEARLERMKKSFEEASVEYEDKISKLKENEAQLIAEHKERIAKLEEEHHADLTKLGEFHRLALDQAVSFSVSLPYKNEVIRLPLRGQQKPKDEVELSEREAALLEKERQVELLKGVLEAEKRELDEALEVDKVRREERERQARRQATEAKLREEAAQAEINREREQISALRLQIEMMQEEALKEQGELAKQRLELAVERARLEASYSIQGRKDSSVPPIDIMQARAEVDAALDTARQAKETAEQDRRKLAELKQEIEQISWEQKEMDLRLDSREKHITAMYKSAEKLRAEGLAAIDEAKAMKEELENRQKEMKEQLKQMETKERVLAKERLEIAKEKIELGRRKTQLEIILPELTPEEELTINPPKVFVDPKAIIMRLKAEKELESFITTQK